MKSNLENSLVHSLKKWTDIDVIAFRAGVALGIIPPLSGEKEIYNLAVKNGYFGRRTLWENYCLISLKI